MWRPRQKKREKEEPVFLNLKSCKFCVTECRIRSPQMYVKELIKECTRRDVTVGRREGQSTFQARHGGGGLDHTQCASTETPADTHRQGFTALCVQIGRILHDSLRVFVRDASGMGGGVEEAARPSLEVYGRFKVARRIKRQTLGDLPLRATS